MMEVKVIKSHEENLKPPMPLQLTRWKHAQKGSNHQPAP